MRPRADTLFVWTGAACVSGCPTCPIRGIAAPPETAADLLQQRLATASPGQLVVLVGGEPLLRRDVLRLFAIIRAAGCTPGLVTTGRALVYPQWRDRLRRAGVGYLRLQLFGVGDAHDQATGAPGAFAQAMAGLRAWMTDPGDCDVDVVLSTRSMELFHLAAALEQLAAAVEKPDVSLVVAADAAEISPASQAALRDAAAALAGWNDDAVRPLLVWEAPAELLPPAALRVAAPHVSFVGAAPAATCLGVAAAMARNAAPDAAETRANSFNFVASGAEVPATAAAADCTAAERGAGSDALRQLWLVNGDRLVQYATDTGDFPATEIARIKDDLSHLFFDRQRAGVLDDIAEGFRRVRPDPFCTTCGRRVHCGTRFQLIDEPPFAAQEAWIRAHVAALQGRVLDVGCGEQPYRDVLAPLLAAERVRYTGLDPDQPSLDHARAALPEGRYWLGGIEDFVAAPASYDHLLCLRSLNHVFDLDEAFSRMAALLRRGGSLLLIETTPFAMLRRPEQVAAADRAPRAGHQHFRNVASEDVLPLARRHRFQIVEHSPSSLGSTNQWILLLERA